ncbi:MAG: primosomal protein N' [Pirellulaceae bacterium]
MVGLSDAGIEALTNPLRKLPAKQKRVLEVAAQARHPLPVPELCERAGCTTRACPVAAQVGTARRYRRASATGDVDFGPLPNERPLVLSADQARALGVIETALQNREAATLLLHGVTGSGKTEVYLQAIQQVIRRGQQAIVLVPEISLTPQTRQRFRARFEQVAVLHSHLSPAERHWQWKRIADGDVHAIVGARAAIFAPAPRLGLIVIDEEHDASFKQDKIPRYHAREVAIQRSKMLNIPLVLGTATPSLETWAATQQGQAQLVPLPHRVQSRPLPDVVLVDLRDEFRSRATRGMIGRSLHARIRVALAEEGQIILLLNRRGFATSIQCPACGHVVLCPNCDLALTHHRDGSKAICHYCDYEIAEPKFCPDCGFDGIRLLVTAR